MVIRFSKKGSDQFSSIKDVKFFALLTDDDNNVIGFKVTVNVKGHGIQTVPYKAGEEFDWDQFEIVPDDSMPCYFAMREILESAGIRAQDFNNADDFVAAASKALNHLRKRASDTDSESDVTTEVPFQSM